MPSLTTLHRLCQALQISVTSLLQAADEQACVLYRENERPRYASGWVEGDGSMAERLVPFEERRLLEAHIIHVPGGGTWCGPYQHAAMRINREEIFGPVAAIIPVRGYDEALAVANVTTFGLYSSNATRR